jgi:hypothetical protein
MNLAQFKTAFTARLATRPVKWGVADSGRLRVLSTNQCPIEWLADTPPVTFCGARRALGIRPKTSGVIAAAADAHAESIRAKRLRAFFLAVCHPVSIQS